MPLVEDGQFNLDDSTSLPRRSSAGRRYSSHSPIARSAAMQATTQRLVSDSAMPTSLSDSRYTAAPHARSSTPPPNTDALAPPPRPYTYHRQKSSDELRMAEDGKKRGNTVRFAREGMALNDTPATTPSTTAPGSPSIPPKRQNSYDKPRPRPTTLDIPGLTKSKVSPDGRIAQRDVGSKLVIVMVGLPARGKSYITKKVSRYLNWLQHDTRIFNVGERRRVAAGGRSPSPRRGPVPNPNNFHARANSSTGSTNGVLHSAEHPDAPKIAAHILLNGEPAIDLSSPKQVRDAFIGGSVEGTVPELHLPEAGNATATNMVEAMDQSATFFDPGNRKAALIREQCALESLDELLDYILLQGGAVGILDATNSTLERRKLIMKHIRERAGPDLNVLFMESICVDENLLERNMRLKLSGPDYKNRDPESSLADFKKRVKMYEKNYVSLGEYEEKHNMPYVQMIDVGRKVISHQVKGFLSAQAVYYLLNFNLSPRQIWITRHGQSNDNMKGNIGGDSDLSPYGIEYAKVLTRFIDYQRQAWEEREIEKLKNCHLPPRPGDSTPPNPHYMAETDTENAHKNFCVWTSMLKRSIQTAQFFDEDEYEIKQMRMLDELSSGYMEGLNYEEIKTNWSEEYERRREDKLHYRYPGPGGEGYLDVINRLRPVIVELERMTDHVLLVGHRSVARVLLAYFKGLPRDDVTDLEVSLGMLYCLEPKPYGVDFKAYRYNAETQWFDEEPDYKLQRATTNQNYVE